MKGACFHEPSPILKCRLVSLSKSPPKWAKELPQCGSTYSDYDVDSICRGPRLSCRHNLIATASSSACDILDPEDADRNEHCHWRGVILSSRKGSHLDIYRDVLSLLTKDLSNRNC